MSVRGRFAARVVLVVVLSAAAVALGAGAAAAGSSDNGLDRNDQIVLNGRLIVPEGQTVNSAVILNGPATIDGTVRETLFVLNGDVDVAGTVGKDVVVLNGDVVVRSTAHVGGDVVSQSSATIESGATVDGRLRNVATRFRFEGIGFASRLVWWIGYSASTLFLGLLLLLLFPGIDSAVVVTWRDRAGGAIGAGAAMFFLLPIAAIILLVTIVGIPLGLFMLLALALVYTVGYVAGAQTLGRLLVNPPTSRFLAFLAGWAILRVIGLVPVLGGFVWMIASLIGLGVLTVAARRTRPAATPATPATPAPPPPPAPASAPV